MNWSLIVILLLMLGMFFLLIEIFIIPGFGLVGIIAFVLLGGGTYLAWAKLDSQIAILTTVGSILSVIFSIWFLTKSKYGKKMVLQKVVGGDLKTIQGRKEVEGKDIPISVGMVGVARSNLRPSGIGEFAGIRLNILTDGIYIKSDTKIKIVKIEGKKFFVEIN
ncbi:MAG: hypothetical protein V1872_04290 [bacterium]